MIRAVYIAVRLSVDMSSKINQSRRDDNLLAPIFSFVYIWVADLVPITSQLSSMLVVINKENDSGYTETSGSIYRESEHYFYDSFKAQESKPINPIEESADFAKNKHKINGSEELYIEKFTKAE